MRPVPMVEAGLLRPPPGKSSVGLGRDGRCRPDGLAGRGVAAPSRMRSNPASDNSASTATTGDSPKAGLNLEQALAADLPAHANNWERVVRRLAARQMPPRKRRPSEKDYDRLVVASVTPSDRAAARAPNPGRTDTFRRLNRTEYQNTIRDLLGLEIDAAALLPRTIPATGLTRHRRRSIADVAEPLPLPPPKKSAASLSVFPESRPGGETYRAVRIAPRKSTLKGLPPKTRGGMLIRHTFPRDGDYEIQVRLSRDPQ